MSAPVQNPPTPHLQPIPSGFQPGYIAHITGNFLPGAASLILKFQSGPSGDPADDIGLCLYGRIQEGQLGRNNFSRGTGWGTEELTPGVQGLAPGQAFDVTVMCDPVHFKIAFNGRHICEFNHRVNPASLTFLQVASLVGDLTLSCVWIEQGAPPPQQPAYASAPPAMGGAPYGAAPPPYSSGQPPMPYNPNPQPGYAPPPGMAQPPQQPYPQQQQPYPQQQQPYPQQPYPQGGAPHKDKGLAGMLTGVAGAMGASSLLQKAMGGSHGQHGGQHPGQGGGYGGYPQGGGGAW